MIQAVGVLIVGFVVLILFAVFLFSLFETREVWNGGICAESRHPWQVIEINGGLFLDDCHGHRRRLGAIVVHPAIIDAFRRQNKRARV